MAYYRSFFEELISFVKSDFIQNDVGHCLWFCEIVLNNLIIFICVFIYLIYLFIYLFIHLFIYVFSRKKDFFAEKFSRRYLNLFQFFFFVILTFKNKENLKKLVNLNNETIG